MMDLSGGAPNLGAARVSDKMEPGPNVVFVGGIPATLQSTDELVVFLAERFGPVEAFKLVVDGTTNKHKGYGFVKFQSSEVAESARRVRTIEFRGKMMNLSSAYSGGSQDRRQPPRGGGGAPGMQGMYAYSAPQYGGRGTTPGGAPPGGAPGGSDGVCRYWLRNACRKGRSCPFKHSQPGGVAPVTSPGVAVGQPAGYATAPDAYNDYYAQLYYYQQYGQQQQQAQQQHPGATVQTHQVQGQPAGYGTAGQWSYGASM